MNSATIEDEVKVEEKGPGELLKSIREDQELDLSRVASQLHLNVSTLRALEADEFEKLPGSVFVQGYLKNYARLLGLPVEPILEAYENLRPEVKDSSNLKMGHVRHEVRSSHLVVRMMTWAIVIGLVILFVIWWRGYLQWPLQVQMGETQISTPLVASPELNEMDAGQDPGMGEEEVILGEKVMRELSPIPEDAADVPLPMPAVPEQVETSLPIVDTTQEIALPAIKPVVEPVVSITEEVVPEAEEIVAPPSEEVTVSSPVIQLDFAGPCWIDVKDSLGGFRVVGERKAGSSLLLEGKAPYRILLGNAAIASMTIDGERFDMAPYITGNVARFTLELDD